ncbi:MAG: hypothetical protein AAGA54_27080 [Myxococcota bacterium]
MAPDAALTATALLAVRWFVLLRVQPQWGLLLGRAWWLVSAGVALVLAAATGPSLVAPTDTLLGRIAAESLLGGTIGVLTSLPAYALLGAGAASGALLGVRGRPFAYLVAALASSAALALGLHHPALVVLRDLAAALPPGAPGQWLASHALTPAAVSTGLDGMLVLALSLATPVLLTRVMLQLAGAALSAGPAEARPLSDAVVPTLAALAAVLALAASWAAYPASWAQAAMPTG